MGDLIRLHANPIGPRSVDQEPGFDPLSPAPASCPPIDLERAARATRDAGMCEALRVDLYAQFRPEPSLWQRFKAMREDVPEAVRLVWGDIVAAPQSHALVAIVAFNLPLLALLIGAWWVGALS
jgi:hypothetical protein